MSALAIEGVRRTVKERVDGTLVLSVEISPIHKADFHRLFPDIDMPVALAPLNLVQKPAMSTEHGQAEKVDKPGPLCLLAVQWCKDKQFQEWLWQMNRGYWTATTNVDAPSEEGAKAVICDICGILSRKELDTSLDAATTFHTGIRLPYNQYLKENNL